MCKFLHYEDNVPQYEFCQEYKDAREQQELWEERLKTATYECGKAVKKVIYLQRTHCPIDRTVGRAAR